MVAMLGAAFLDAVSDGLRDDQELISYDLLKDETVRRRFAEAFCSKVEQSGLVSGEPLVAIKKIVCEVTEKIRSDFTISVFSEQLMDPLADICCEAD